jgi:E3 ubiquitin-protein ligase UHRF1
MLSYAEERDANIARNKEMLARLGVETLKPTTEPKEARHQKQKKPKPAGNKRKADADSDSDVDEKPYAKSARVVANDENAVPQPDDSTGSRRRSSRIAGKPADALARVEQTRGTPQPMSVKALVRDASAPKRARRYNPCARLFYVVCRRRR